MDKSNSPSLPVLLILIIGLPALVLGLMAFIRTSNIVSDQIADRTISEADLKEELAVRLTLPDDQVLDTTLLTDESTDDDSDVLGITTEDGDWRVFVEDDGLVVKSDSVRIGSKNIKDGSIQAVDLGENSVNSTHIQNGTILQQDLAFQLVNSINGLTGGGVNLVGGNNISITTNSGTNSIEVAVLDGAGSGLDADKLDGRHGSFYQNASNINAGTLHTDYYSAYNDLTVEGYLDFTEDGDLVTKGQADDEYINADGDTMTGLLTIDGPAGGGILLDNATLEGTAAIIDLDATSTITNLGDTYLGQTGSTTEITGNITLTPDTATLNNGDLVVTGVTETAGLVVYDFSLHFGPEFFVNDIYTFADMYFGDSPTDTIFLQARIDGNLVPVTTDTYNVGTNALRWRNGFFSRSARVGDGTQDAILRSNRLAVLQSNFRIDTEAGYNLTLDSGNSLLLNAANDRVVVDGNLLPAADATYNVGANARRWDRGFFASAIRTGDVTDNTILTNSTLRSNGSNLRLVSETGYNVNVASGNVINLNPAAGRVNIDGDFSPTVDGAYTLGTATRYWANVYSYEAMIGDASGWGGTNIFSVNSTGANGPEAGPVASVYEVSIDGDLEVTGTIDPTGILLSPLNDGDIAIQVNDITSAPVFTVDENGDVFANSFNGDINGCILTPGGSSYCDDADILGYLNVDGDTRLGDAKTDSVKLEGTISSDTGNVDIADRLTVDEIGSGDASPVFVKDNQGLSVQTYGGANLFNVDGAGNATVEGDLQVNGAFSVDNAVINAQLSVADLVVTNTATVSGSISSNLEPTTTNTYDLGNATFRWRTVYGIDGNFTGTLIVNGTNVDTALSNLSTSVATLQTDVGNLQTAVGTLQTDVTTLQGDVTALQARPVTVGGFTACAGSPTNAAPMVCVINVGSPIAGITVTAVGTGSNIKTSITADPTGASSVTVNVYGSAAGSSVSGLSWTAVLQ